MNTLFVLNDPPYGSERSYQGLRLATSLAKRDAQAVRVFLLGDAVSVAKSGQRVPQGYYNLERMLKALVLAGAQVATCTTCLEARGLAPADLANPAWAGSLAELTDWTEWADRVLVF